MDWEDRVVGRGLVGCLKVEGGDLVELRGVVWEWIVARGFFGGSFCYRVLCEGDAPGDCQDSYFCPSRLLRRVL